jgi:hypothetical protein
MLSGYRNCVLKICRELTCKLNFAVFHAVALGCLAVRSPVAGDLLKLLALLTWDKDLMPRDGGASSSLSSSINMVTGAALMPDLTSSSSSDSSAILISYSDSGSDETKHTLRLSSAFSESLDVYCSAVGDGDSAFTCTSLCVDPLDLTGDTDKPMGETGVSTKNEVSSRPGDREISSKEFPKEVRDFGSSYRLKLSRGRSVPRSRSTSRRSSIISLAFAFFDFLPHWLQCAFLSNS